MRWWLALHCPSWLMRCALVRRALGVMAAEEIEWDAKGDPRDISGNSIGDNVFDHGQRPEHRIIAGGFAEITYTGNVEVERVSLGAGDDTAYLQAKLDGRLMSHVEGGELDDRPGDYWAKVR